MTEKFVHDRNDHTGNINDGIWPKKYDNDEHEWLFRSYSTDQVRRPNEFKALYNFGHFHGYFGHVQPFIDVGVIFRSSSNIHVCRCELFLVIFELIFGHIDLVKITSLITIVTFFVQFFK